MAYSAGAVALVLAGAVQAQVTKSVLDQWSVNNGTISAGSCAAGLTCAAPLTGDGFLTRLVTDTADGKQYYQTIVTMPGATATQAELDKLEFSDENLVSFNNNNGILDKQRIFQDQTVAIPGQADTFHVLFTNGSVIGTGWATDFVDLTQTIEVPKLIAGAAAGGDGFQTDFIYKSVGYNDITQGKSPYGVAMKITNYVPIFTKGGADDRQDFVLVEKRGDFMTPAGSATLPNQRKLLPTDPDTLTLTWKGDTAAGANTGVVGDRVQALWIGQNLSATAGQQFGFGAYTNFTDDKRISMFSLADPLGSAATGVSSPVLDWDPAVWGDLKTQGIIASPPL